jgi:hypothetical protein
MRVNLFFRVLHDPQLEEKLSGIEIIRLKALVRFKTARGWSDIYEAIVDTGAHMSLIPLSIWQEAEHTKLARHRIRGIVPKAGCTLPVLVGKVHCRLVDRQGRRTGPLEIHAFLAQTDEVALILGFKDVLMRFAHHIDYRTDTAYIDARKLKG